MNSAIQMLIELLDKDQEIHWRNSRTCKQKQLTPIQRKSFKSRLRDAQVKKTMSNSDQEKKYRLRV